MLWLFDALQSGDPIPVAYAIYSILSVMVALAVAVMLAVPRWRSKLYTNWWTIFLAGFGWLGAIKLVIFLVSDVYTWNSTVGVALILTIVGAIAVGVIVSIVMWLSACLHGPQPVRRIAEGVAMYGGGLLALYLIDLIEKRYHVPAFFIAMGILLTGILVIAWWQDRKTRKYYASEEYRAQHRREVIELLSKDPADAGALELYLKEHPK